MFFLINFYLQSENGFCRPFFFTAAKMLSARFILLTRSLAILVQQVYEILARDLRAIENMEIQNVIFLIESDHQGDCSPEKDCC